MLHLALVALLMGTPLATFDGGLDGGRDGGQDDNGQAETAEAPEDFIKDSYAYGSDSDEAPIKLWVSYGMGTVEEVFLPNGNTQPLGFDIDATRITVGTQLNFINIGSFSVGIGGELVLAQDQIDQFPPAGNTEFKSGLGVQAIDAYISIAGDVLGVHGGYHFDLGTDITMPQGSDPSNSLWGSDQQNAVFFGADFEYEAGVARIFAGADYYHLFPNDQNANQFGPQCFNGGASGQVRCANNDWIFWTAGLGLRFGFVEVGAAVLLRTQLNRTLYSPVSGNITTPGGSHHGSIAPFLKLSPSFIPASIFVKGAVEGEYGDYGYALGGADQPSTTSGFTVGLTFGFE